GDLAEVCGPNRRVVVARELTKLHEEVFRGTLAEALERVVTTEPRGEHVVVLAGAAPRATEATDDDVETEARAPPPAGASPAGPPTKDAATQVAARLGVSRRRAYDVVVAQRAKPDGPGEAAR